MADLFDAPGLDPVDAVHEAEIEEIFDFRGRNRLGQLDDDGFVGFFGQTGVQQGIQDVRGGVGGDVDDEEVAEVVGQGEGREEVVVDAGGQDVVLRVFLDPPDGPPDAVSIHGAYLYEAESQVVEIVVQLSVQVQSGAQAYGVVEFEAEDFPLQADGAVVVDPAAEEPPARYLLDEFEVPEGPFGGLFYVCLADKRLDGDVI